MENHGNIMEHHGKSWKIKDLDGILAGKSRMNCRFDGP